MITYRYNAVPTLVYTTQSTYPAYLNAHTILFLVQGEPEPEALAMKLCIKVESYMYRHSISLVSVINPIVVSRISLYHAKTTSALPARGIATILH